MPLTLLSGAPAIGKVGAVVAAGRAGQDCLLLAGSRVLAHRRCLVRLVRLVRLDRAAPWRPLTAAASALTAGALTVAAGIATCCKSVWLAAG